MTTLRRIAIFFLINLFGFVTAFLFFNKEAFVIQKVSTLAILGLFVSLLSQLIGFLIVKTGDKNQNFRRIYITTSAICSTLFISLFGYYVWSHWDYQNRNGNIEANSDYIRYFVDEEKEQVQLASKELSKFFKSPNDFELTGNIVHVKRDSSSVSPIKQCLVTLFYSKKGTDGTFRSSIFVEGNIARVIQFDTMLYSLDHLTIEESNRKNFEIMRNSIRQLPDSEQVKIEAILKSFFNPKYEEKDEQGILEIFLRRSF